MDLPVGYHRFHRNPFFNYQLNRLYSLGYTGREEIFKAAKQIRRAADFPPVFIALADRALADNRRRASAMYLRTAEFFIPHGSPQKLQVYNRFIDTFYEVFSDEGIHRVHIPYGDGQLPGLSLEPTGEKTKGTILVFGGFDSLIEEFYALHRSLADAGYRVIAFDGPGQGGALRVYGLTHDHAWEKPTAAVLNHFQLSEAGLIGLSMGGYWAIRAAAREKCITEVVSFPPVYDWLEQVPAFTRPLIRGMANWRRFMNWAVRLRMRLFPILDHAIKQAMYLSGGKEPVDAVHWMLGMNADFLSSEKVRQDVLLLGGANDSFQPPKLLRAQEKALVNARSVTTRIFNEEEQAASHCQMGNFGLATEAIVSWLNQREQG